jgi:hypothetical protein
VVAFTAIVNPGSDRRKKTAGATSKKKAPAEALLAKPKAVRKVLRPETEEIGDSKMTESDTSPRATTGAGMLTNAAKILGEVVFVPGVSLAVDGDIKSGALHAAAALAAGALGPVLGPIGWLVAGLDSYSKSVSGLHIYEHFKPKTADEKKADEKTEKHEKKAAA